MNQARIVFCSCPNRDVALKLAHQIVNEALAACVNLLPGVTSIYRWENAIQEDTEILLMIKTTSRRIKLLIKRLRELHPYQIPEIIAIPITEGYKEYLTWIEQCTG